MRHTLIMLLVAALSGAACSPPGPEPLGPDVMLSAEASGTAVVTSDPGRWPADPVEFREARVEGDTLVATVSYGGGCRDHRFALVFSKLFMESYPVQIGGLLSHDALRDPCRALLTRTLRFDLTPLRDAYRAAYHEHSATIVLNGNWPEALHYRF